LIVTEKDISQPKRDHVHSVYEKIAPFFNDARYKAQPKVQQFISEQEPGNLIADIGCRNGKYLHISSRVHKLGCDYCFPLVDLGHEAMVCHSLCLPYRSQCFHAVLSIDAIHHFSMEERLMRAIKEMARILRVGSQIMIYMWAMEQKRRRFEKQDVFVPWNPSPPSCSSGEPCSCGVQKSILHKDKELALNQPSHKSDGTSEKAVNEGTLTTQSQQRTGPGGAWLKTYYRGFKEWELVIEHHIPELHITHSYFGA
ncbi:PREDICTED: putative methyltransferase KIAA1456, partial [Cariama cristata]|uniref:putative methyltransferase KIAA1456 n=1 Tax=Cariama cristata TaxID=54380 RepID=UPI0005200B9D